MYSALTRRRLDKIIDTLGLSPPVADALITYPGTLQRLYYACINASRAFTPDEHLFSLTIYVQDQLVYELDYALNREQNHIDAFIAAGLPWSLVEVYINNKLAGLFYEKELVYCSVTPVHVNINHDLNQIPVWRWLVAAD